MYSERKRRSAAGPSVKTDGMIRLNKFIASSGLYSRREADRLMEAGDVTVDDEIAQPGRMITGKDQGQRSDHSFAGPQGCSGLL